MYYLNQLEKGFDVTSVDNGNTPYEKNIKMDLKKLNGYWDYIIAGGCPPSQLPKKVKCKILFIQPQEVISKKCMRVIYIF